MFPNFTDSVGRFVIVDGWVDPQDHNIRNKVFLFEKNKEKTFKKNMSPIFFFPFVYFTGQTKSHHQIKKLL